MSEASRLEYLAGQVGGAERAFAIALINTHPDLEALLALIAARFRSRGSG